mmetsp:Transcript_356/g.917  ORF Transcript_356/g.917 Transcript_356/m.917 type:complete len:128 (+) Transcript_356:3540-3923(+)
MLLVLGFYRCRRDLSKQPLRWVETPRKSLSCESRIFYSIFSCDNDGNLRVAHNIFDKVRGLLGSSDSGRSRYAYVEFGSQKTAIVSQKLTVLASHFISSAKKSLLLDFVRNCKIDSRFCCRPDPMLG